MQRSYGQYLVLIVLIHTALFGYEDLNIPKDFTQLECSVETTGASPRFTQLGCTLKPISKQSNRNTGPHKPLPFKNSASLNWSGYATLTSLTKPTVDSVSAVYGTWVVPTLSSTPDQSYCSIWVGIDGYSDSTVEQIGTGHDWASGKQQNFAWFEMYPNYAYEIVGFPVNINDSISGAVVYTGRNIFSLALLNNTKKVYVIIPTSYTTSSSAKRTSAEWIVEAPSSTQVLPLAHFSTVSFSDCSAVINNIPGSISDHLWTYDPLTMVTSNGTVKAAISGLLSGGESFTVTWKHE